jgi:two-component system sensor histidine kinase KdpD
MSAFGRSDVFRLGAALATLAVVTLTLGPLLQVSNAATVSTTYLMVVLFVAAASRLRVAIVTSVAAMLCLNFFFLPPVGTFTIADPQNWIALFAFLAVSLVASNLSAVAQKQTHEALSRRDELARLFDLSRDVLMMTESREALSVLARTIARRFDLEYVAIALPRAAEWDAYAAGSQSIELDRRQLTTAFAAAQATLASGDRSAVTGGTRVLSDWIKDGSRYLPRPRRRDHQRRRDRRGAPQPPARGEDLLP